MGATSKRWSRSLMVVAGFLLVVGAQGRVRPPTRRRTRFARSCSSSTRRPPRTCRTPDLRALVKDRGQGEEGRRRGRQDDEGGEGQGEAVQLQRRADPRPGRARPQATTTPPRSSTSTEAELANKVKSGPKMLQAYENLIDLYFDAKRYSRRGRHLREGHGHDRAEGGVKAPSRSSSND